MFVSFETSRPYLSVLNAPQKGDKVIFDTPPSLRQFGVHIELLVKDVLDVKGETMLNVRFKGENDVIKQWKKVRMGTWQDHVKYLRRKSDAL